MSDENLPAPRPVSLAAVACIFVLLSLFWVIAVRVYEPGRPAAPQNLTPDNLSKDNQWRATPASRRAYLAELRNGQAKQAASYGWVDRKAGVVQLPIERAMELVVQEHGGAK
jgi:hypothetical protein